MNAHELLVPCLISAATSEAGKGQLRGEGARGVCSLN